MTFDKNKFALAAATTMTLMKTIKMFLWWPLCGRIPMFRGIMWKYHCGLGAKHFPGGFPKAVPPEGCPWGYPIMKILTVFVLTFAAAWFFAWLYNKMVEGK